MKNRATWRLRAAAVVAFCVVVSIPAQAAPAPLADWGNFSTATAICQRAIGRAAATCARRAIHNRNLCLTAEIDERQCDRQIVDDVSTAQRARALAMIGRHCDENAAQSLGFVDLSDARAQIEQACEETETAVISAVWGPVTIGESTAVAGDDEQRCLVGSARAASRLLRFAIRVQQRTLDRVAGEDTGAERKSFEIERARRLVARIRRRAEMRLAFECQDTDFAELYGRNIATLASDVAQRADCINRFAYRVDGVFACPAPVCGNGVVESGEQCDDGNAFEGDACLSDCVRAECDSFAGTYDLIQRAVFEKRGCTAEICHSTANPGGGLDLTAGNSYAAMIDVPAQTAPGLHLVDPGDRSNSLLWLNVAAKIFPDVTAPLRAMPLGPDSLSAAEVELIRLWIEVGAASRTASVPGTAELLGACLPEPDPPPARLPAPLGGTTATSAILSRARD